MMGDLELRNGKIDGVWRLHGYATIDERAASSCWLTIRKDGTWSAQLIQFTLAAKVDLFFVSDDGGHFCGEAFVERSRADTGPFATHTDLSGSGPLLIVAPGSVPEPEGAMVDGEVLDDRHIEAPTS